MLPLDLQGIALFNTFLGLVNYSKNIEQTNKQNDKSLQDFNSEAMALHDIHMVDDSIYKIEGAHHDS